MKPRAKTPVRYSSKEKEIICYTPSVTDLTLSLYEISWDSEKKIDITTDVFNPNADVLNYRYDVSAGTIIGKGQRVAWDLTGVSPGTYTITAAVDDGCGFCGQSRTRTVRVND